MFMDYLRVVIDSVNTIELLREHDQALKFNLSACDPYFSKGNQSYRNCSSLKKRGILDQ